MLRGTGAPFTPDASRTVIIARWASASLGSAWAGPVDSTGPNGPKQGNAKKQLSIPATTPDLPAARAARLTPQCGSDTGCPMVPDITPLPRATSEPSTGLVDASHPSPDVS